MAATARGACRTPGRARSFARYSHTLTLLTFATLLFPHKAGATRDVTGQWSPNADSSRGNGNRYAINLVLLRGDATYHSRILWWGHLPGQFGGDEWGWNPNTVACDEFPGQSLTSIGIPYPGMDVFCAGQAPIDGRLLVAGGTSPIIGNYGERQSRVLRDTTGGLPKSWYDPGSMADWRWYPTLTTLGTGRILTTSGSRAPHHRVFGGRLDGAIPTNGVQDSLYRFFPVAGGQWDRSVIPQPDPVHGRPTWREFHSATQLERTPNTNGHVIFGGKDSLGSALNDFWVLRREPNIGGNDYGYKWVRKASFLFGSQPPSPRSRHSAIAASDVQPTHMLVYGGRDTSGNAFDGDVYRYNGDGGGYWPPKVVIQSGTPPANRFGHSAFFDNTTFRGRMIVFGGIGADGQTPSDLATWQLRFTASDFSTASWGAMTEVTADSGNLDRKPAPRFDHAVAWDGALHWNNRAQKWGHVGFLFGGQLGTAAYSDTLWLMWLFADSTMGWEPRFFGGPRPAARARCSLLLDATQGAFVHANSTGGARLYLIGGDTSTGPADDSVYVLDPWDNAAGPPKWSKWAGRGKTSSHAPATLDYEITLARTAEVFSPGASPAGQWQSPLTSSTLLQDTYPPTFVISGGATAGHRVLATAANDSSYWLDVATSGAGTAWTRQALVGFDPQSGVLYAPNRIMVAGGTAGTGSSAAVGTTKTLDAANLNNTWQSSGTMAPRAYTNLVLLPNGKVLAVGGMDAENSNLTDPAHAVNRPQIWDPATGAWTDTTVLERQPTIRNYHSTALLLPDGRVLSGGGEFQSQRFLFNVFCPPYLFKPHSDLLATRPVIDSAPNAMTWGSLGSYTLCVADTTGIRRACLVRPGATTHGFDENQRYVPLTLKVASNPSRLLVVAPANAADAPPGNYLLFVTGSPDGADVPGIARWVTVGSATAADVCDVVAPATVSSLSATPCAGGIDSQYLLHWTAPADDGALTDSRRAASYDIRQYGAPITDANWSQAEPISGPTPGDPGSTESVLITVSELTYIRMKSKDDKDGQGNWSGLSNQVTLHPNLCGEGGLFAGGGEGEGSGYSLKPVPGAVSAVAGTLSSVAAVENSLLNGVAMGTGGRDHLWLGALQTSSDGTCGVRVRAGPDHAAALDAVQLLAVDHPADALPHVLGGTIVLGTQQGAERVISSDGTDLTSTLAAGSSYTLVPGDTLTVDLGPSGGASPLIVTAHGRGALEYLVPDGAGGWHGAHRFYPRTAPDAVALHAPGTDLVRLVTLGAATIHSIGQLVVAGETPTVESASLVSSHSTRTGDVKALVFASDTANALLAGPDTLALVYAVAPPAPGLARDYFLIVDATPLDPKRLAALTNQNASALLPARFALRQNLPNPFARSTSIRFELPVGAMVRLEIFDAQGRRVTTLANRYFAPGFHAVSWSPAASPGELGPGVYFCRLDAGSFRARGRMVLLP